MSTQLPGQRHIGVDRASRDPDPRDALQRFQSRPPHPALKRRFDTARRFRSERLTRAVMTLRAGLGTTVTGTEVDALDMRRATMYEKE